MKILFLLAATLLMAACDSRPQAVASSSVAAASCAVPGAVGGCYDGVHRKIEVPYDGVHRVMIACP